MMKRRELLLIAAYVFAVAHTIDAESCECSKQPQMESQIKSMQNQISALTKTMKNLAWSVMKMEMTFDEFANEMAAIGLIEGFGPSASDDSTCSAPPSVPANNTGTQNTIKSCKDVSKSGVFSLQPDTNSKPLRVVCDAEYEGGSWVVIQNRFNGSLDFYRNWTDYMNGFGDLNGEFWLGNNIIAQLTQNNAREIHFVMTDWEGKSAVAKYAAFKIGNETEKFILKSLGAYSGTAGDSLSRNVNSKFSTRDADNDSAADAFCANLYFGGWWYDNCHLSNLNGKYVKGTVSEYATMMCWSSFRGFYYGLKTSRIMIRV